MSKIDDISEFLTSSVKTAGGRARLALLLEKNSYITKLLDLFRKCEDLKDLANLRKLFVIIKTIFLLNKLGIFEILIQEENLMSVIGCLEYNPNLQETTKHRDYLTNEVKFNEVLPINNVQLRKKIHQTFRLQYIQDVILPTLSVPDEDMLPTLASLIFFNKVSSD